jgi:hypothetical protein
MQVPQNKVVGNAIEFKLRFISRCLIVRDQGVGLSMRRSLSVTTQYGSAKIGATKESAFASDPRYITLH